MNELYKLLTITDFIAIHKRYNRIITICYLVLFGSLFANYTIMKTVIYLSIFLCLTNLAYANKQVPASGYAACKKQCGFTYNYEECQQKCKVAKPGFSKCFYRAYAPDNRGYPRKQAFDKCLSADANFDKCYEQAYTFEDIAKKTSIDICSGAKIGFKECYEQAYEFENIARKQSLILCSKAGAGFHLCYQHAYQLGDVPRKKALNWCVQADDNFNTCFHKVYNQSPGSSENKGKIQSILECIPAIKAAEETADLIEFLNNQNVSEDINYSSSCSNLEA